MLLSAYRLTAEKGWPMDIRLIMSNKTRSRQFFAICFVPVGMIVEKYAMTENPLWLLLMT